jgi:uncharacterized repeat protein (TIGR03847 family)
MSDKEIDLQPVTHLTTDAIGPAGARVFYIQGWQDERIITLIVEKIQIQSLALGVEQFLAEVKQKYPDLTDATVDYLEEKMHILPPVDPLFRVGELGLGYDVENDQVVLVARELLAEGQEADDGRVVRFWCSRSQIRAMSNWGIQVAARGRPICPQCGEPMDPEGHFCPKRNGHKH